MLPDDNLWTRIEQFELDEPDAGFPFSARLAKETGWTYPHTQRVIEEYRRFVYLACVAGHPVSPADEVDEVWHLHLTYTESYWGRFCPQVIDRPLHHQPTRGGRQEGAKFEDWYRRTLESYERIFGPAPEDIWPRPEQHYASTPKHEIKVDTLRYWVIPKPHWWPLRFRMTAGMQSQWLPFAALLAAVLGGCASGGGSLGPWDLRGPDFLILYWGLCIVAGSGGLWWRSRNLLPDDSRFPHETLHPALIARLTSPKPEWLAQTVIASLLDQGALQIGEGGKLEIPPGTERRKPALEAAFWDAVATGRAARADWVNTARQFTDGLDATLGKSGLLLSHDTYFTTCLAPQLINGAVLCFGVAKIFIGLSRNRPVEYLTITCLLLFVWMLVFEFGMQPRRTRRGERYLQQLRSGRQSKPAPEDGVVAGMAMAVALYGATALPLELRPLFQPPPSTADGGGSSCGSSDGGGSSCGSSCGSSGCGGCGGGH